MEEGKKKSSEDRSGMEWMTQENDEKYIFKRKMKSFFCSTQKVAVRMKIVEQWQKKGRKKSNDPIYLNLHPLNIYRQ